MTFKACLAVLTLFIAIMRPDFAQAQYMMGADLTENCNSKAAGDVYRCLGYIEGVIDYHVVMQSLGTTPTTDFCLPEGLRIEEAAIAVLAYLQKSPQHSAFIAAPAITLALNQVYPCAKPRQKRR
jgi:hypothetical protein